MRVRGSPSVYDAGASALREFCTESSVRAPPHAHARPRLRPQMSEKTKPKTAKKKAPAQQSVLGNLPATRPTRLARRQPEPAKVEAAAKAEVPAPAAPAATESRATEPAKKAGTRTTKPAAPRRTAKAKPAAAKGRPRATATATEAPAPKTFDRKAASGRAATRRPRAVSAGAPSLEQPERREPAPPPSNGGVPRGTELVTTAIQAAGELTKIGITVGSQIVKRTLERLPRR